MKDLINELTVAGKGSQEPVDEQKQYFEKAVQTLNDMDIRISTDELEIVVDFINIEDFKIGFGYDSHMHSSFEFHYIKRGNGIVELENTSYRLSKKSFYVCAPYVVHRQIADRKEPMLEYALKCSINKAKGRYPVENTTEGGFLLDILKNNSFKVVKDNYNMEGIFDNIFDEAADKNPGYFMQIKNQILQLIIFAARNITDSMKAEYRIPMRNIESHRMKLIEEYINDNLARNILCSELARQFFLSEKQLNRVIRKNKGISTHEYIMNLKIMKAKDMLSNFNMTLHEIADCTGFANEYHLSARFKKHSGVSPRDYRKQLIKKDDTLYVQN